MANFLNHKIGHTRWKFPSQEIPT